MFSNTLNPVIQSENFRYVFIKGKGYSNAPLVMLHGMFGGLSNFDPLIKLMGKSRDIIVPEMPLYAVDNRDYTIPELTRWVIDNVITGLGLSNVILLGNSLGGHIAIDCAVVRPDLVKGLILTGSSGLFEDGFGCSRPKRFDRNYIRERASMTFYDYEVEESMIDEIQSILRSRKKLSKLVKIARSARDYNMGTFLGKIQQPCMLIWGRNDRITPPAVALALMNELPNARLKWIDECGHAPMMEKPLDFVRTISDFLSEIETPVTNGFTRISQIDKKYERQKSYS